MTFPSALRSTLRADPDVILVGEVRDAETARIAADASITGHLVLSTLHATRSAAAPIRLIDMGVEPYLVASAVSCIAAQRLARKLCDNCAKPDRRAPTSRCCAGSAQPTRSSTGASTCGSPVGCSNCRQTGYRGRAAIFEIMPVTEDISRLIVERAAERRHRTHRGRTGHGHAAGRRAAPRAAAATSASTRWCASSRSRSSVSSEREAHDAEGAGREAVDAERRQALRLEEPHEEPRRDVRGDRGERSAPTSACPRMPSPRWPMRSGIL